MSGKRAKPSPWRFLRAAPVAIVAAVVWVMVGFFLLLPSGSDQAHDWGLDPIPSTSADEEPSEPDSSTATSPEPSTPGIPPPDSTTAAADGPSSTQAPASDGELRRASAPGRTAEPSPRPTSDATSAAPTEHTPGPPEDNPGKKKGHDKPHGPHGQRP